MQMQRDPQTPEQWQEAVDLARFTLLLHNAAVYGLVDAPPVNVPRCEEVLRQGRRLGFIPRSDQLVDRDARRN
jgi:hypothetical protein